MPLEVEGTLFSFERNKSIPSFLAEKLPEVLFFFGGGTCSDALPVVFFKQRLVSRFVLGFSYI